MSESKELETNVADAWFSGKYTEEQAQLSAELQSLDFNNIKQAYGELYHNYEVQSR